MCRPDKLYKLPTLVFADLIVHVQSLHAFLILLLVHQLSRACLAVPCGFVSQRMGNLFVIKLSDDSKLCASSRSSAPLRVTF